MSHVAKRTLTYFVSSRLHTKSRTWRHCCRLHFHCCCSCCWPVTFSSFPFTYSHSLGMSLVHFRSILLSCTGRLLVLCTVHTDLFFFMFFTEVATIHTHGDYTTPLLSILLSALVGTNGRRLVVCAKSLCRTQTVFHCPGPSNIHFHFCVFAIFFVVFVCLYPCLPLFPKLPLHPYSRFGSIRDMYLLSFLFRTILYFVFIWIPLFVANLSSQCTSILSLFSLHRHSLSLHWGTYLFSSSATERS